MTRARIFFILAAVSALNTLPAFMGQLGGDIHAHLVMLQCFSMQFWQGDLYPRWCMEGAAGMGMPYFMFYAPLPYLIASLFHPFGLDGYPALSFSYLLATFVTACTCFYWLRHIVTDKTALLATALFLFMPYRMEAMYFRFAYSETWQIAWVPLILLFTRRIALGEQGIWPLAVAVALSFFCNVPCTLIILMIAGLYMLFCAQSWKARILYWPAGIALGAALAGFYLIPGWYYAQYVRVDEMNDATRAWANLFPSLTFLSRPVFWRVDIMMAAMAATFIALSYYVATRRKLIPEDYLRREVSGWLAISLIMLVLFLPVSAPLYTLLQPISHYLFPWRMQLAFALCMAFMAAIAFQYMLKPKKTFVADTGILFGFLVLSSFFVSSYIDDSPEKAAALADAEIVHKEALFFHSDEYRTLWTDKDHFSKKYIRKLYDEKSKAKSAELINGGSIDIKQWGWDGIIIHYRSPNPATLKINHTYFPTWAAKLDNGQALKLYAEEGSGRMLVKVPSGEHQVIISFSILHGLGGKL